MTPTVIALIQPKGGVGKTTTAANLAAITAALGHKTLMIDADAGPEGRLSSYFASPESLSAQYGLADIIGSGGRVTQNCIVPTSLANLDVVVPNMRGTTGDTTGWLNNRPDGIDIFRRAVNQPVIRDSYRYVVIDSPGDQGYIKSVAASANIILCPIQTARKSFEAFLNEGLTIIRDLQGSGLLEIKCSVFINMFNPRLKTDRTRDEQYKKFFDNHPQAKLLNSKLLQAEILRQAEDMGSPAYKVGWVKNTPTRTYELLHALVHEILPELNGQFAQKGN